MRFGGDAFKSEISFEIKIAWPTCECPEAARPNLTSPLLS